MNKKENNVENISDYEKGINKRKKMAQIIWDNAFMSGLTKFNKNELLDIIQALVFKLDVYENIYRCKEEFEDLDVPEDYRDFKDLAFDYKCILIATLDEDFFKDK